MFRTTDQDRQNLLNLAPPVRREFTATMLDIDRLPVTRFEPFVPDWQTIDWSANRPDIAPAVADGYARDAERIRNLPEAPRVRWAVVRTTAPRTSRSGPRPISQTSSTRSGLTRLPGSPDPMSTDLREASTESTAAASGEPDARDGHTQRREP
jgi:hypothetical protein